MNKVVQLRPEAVLQAVDAAQRLRAGAVVRLIIKAMSRPLGAVEELLWKLV